MAKLSFLVRASLGSFLTERPSRIARYLPLLCHLKSVPQTCWPLSKSLYSKFGTPFLHLQLWTLLLCFLMIRAGDRNCFITLPVPIIKNLFSILKESEWYNHKYMNCLSFWRWFWSQSRLLLCCPLGVEQSDFYLPIFTFATFWSSCSKLSQWSVRNFNEIIWLLCLKLFTDFPFPIPDY